MVELIDQRGILSEMPKLFFTVFFSFILLFAMPIVGSMHSLRVESTNVPADDLFTKEWYKEFVQNNFPDLSFNKVPTWYQLLGVEKGATENEVKRIKNALLRYFHVDKHPEASYTHKAALNLAAQAITEAYKNRNAKQYNITITMKKDKRWYTINPAKDRNDFLEYNSEAQDSLRKYEQMTDQFKKFYMRKFGIIAGIGLFSILKNYCHSRAKINKNGILQKLISKFSAFKKRHSTFFSAIKTTTQITLAGFLSIYPLYKFWPVFECAGADWKYQSEKNNKYPLDVYHQYYSILEQRGDVKYSQPYYVSPHCYVTDQEKSELFRPLRRAKVQRVALIGSILMGLIGPFLL